MGRGGIPCGGGAAWGGAPAGRGGGMGGVFGTRGGGGVWGFVINAAQPITRFQ